MFKIFSSSTISRVQSSQAGPSSSISVEPEISAFDHAKNQIAIITKDIAQLDARLARGVAASDEAQIVLRREQLLESLLEQEIIKYAAKPDEPVLAEEPVIPVIPVPARKNKFSLLSMFSASSEASLMASEYIATQVYKPFDREGLERARQIIQFRRRFSEFVTKNTGAFAEKTYFLVSMEKNNDPNQDQMFLYPGTRSCYHEHAEVPEEFRHPDDPLQMHPDLDIQIRRKAHRVFHEQVLGQDIPLLQTILPHPFVDSYATRGGGAVLDNDNLHSKYKSGVLNGKWNAPGAHERLSYGELQSDDRQRFNVAMAKTTGKTVISPEKRSFIPLDEAVMIEQLIPSETDASEPSSSNQLSF